MNLPILAFCDGWLKVFRSTEEAAVYIEPVDVENGAWEAFDSTGHVLLLSVGRRHIRGIGRLLGQTEEVVEITPAVPPHIEESRLRELLQAHLAKVSRVGRRRPTDLSPEAVSKLPLDELVAKAATSDTSS